jgi:hypothetical protein
VIVIVLNSTSPTRPCLTLQGKRFGSDLTIPRHLQKVVVHSRVTPPRKGNRSIPSNVVYSILHYGGGRSEAPLFIIRLKIFETIRVEDGQNAQLVTVQASSHITPNNSNAPPSDRCLVAKFYDPLYFDHEQDDADPFLCTDYHYTHEVAAYKALDPLQGTNIMAHTHASCRYQVGINALLD